MPDVDLEDSVTNSVVIFFHVEAADSENQAGVIQKFVKNARWLCGKFDTRNVVLHSFNHLSTSKANPDIAKGIFEEVRERLNRTGYHVFFTPFGYFNEFSIKVGGESLAKVFKEF
jgi:hypothetical protein